LWVREARPWFFGALVALVLVYAISQQYRVNLKGEWKVGRNFSGEIILTPTRQSRSPGSSEEE
jgi:hypothetical protein